MALNAWQLLTRVLPGQPFGTGADGDYSSATAPTLTKDSCSGTSTSTTLTTSGSTFANGDILLIHQTRGTGVGQWEINKVASGGGSTSLTLSVALQYTYTDSGASQAQAIKIPMYKDVTVQSGTWSPTDWDENIGGILIFAAKSLTLTGNISGIGSNGPVVNNQLGNYATSRATGGFKGGYGYIKTTAGYTPLQGEGISGTGTASASANGNGGGAPQNNDGGGGASGAGGGNATAGTTVTVNGNTATGGGVAGNDNLTNMVFGGGGGGGGRNDSNPSAVAGGGAGGKIIVIFSRVINSPTGTISLSGGNGGNAVNTADGGGGAGGSLLICGGLVDIGTDKLSSIAGTAGGGSGGAGGKGRIAVYYGTSLTGSISSSLYGTYTNEQDTSLKESAGGAWLMFM